MRCGSNDSGKMVLESKFIYDYHENGNKYGAVISVMAKIFGRDMIRQNALPAKAVDAFIGLTRLAFAGFT
jgi:hypothetical protein